jgi:hypothetical protein
MLKLQGEAILKLTAQKLSHDEASLYVYNAAKILGKNANATVEDFVNQALTVGKFYEKGEDLKTIPNAMDAINGMISLGHKESDAIKLIRGAVKYLGKTASAEDYIKAALSKTKTAPEASAAPEVAPVSKSPSSPVSSKHPEPEKAGTPIGEKELGNAQWDKNGMVTWKRPDGKISFLHPNELKNIASPRLAYLLMSKGYYKKFPNAINPLMKNFGEKPNVDEEIVNPFSVYNLI